MEQGIDGEDLVGMFRVKEKLNAVIMSDITTVDGKFIEDFVPDSQHLTETSLKHKFSQEELTEEDWNKRRQFWQQNTNTGYELNSPLRE